MNVPVPRLEIRAKLFVLEFDTSGDEVSTILGVQPTRTWRKGDPVTEAAKNTQPSNGWMLSAPVDPRTATADEAVRALIALLPDRRAFTRLPLGAKVQMTFTLFGYEERPYLDLSSNSVQALAEIGASLDVDVYDLTESTT